MKECRGNSIILVINYFQSISIILGSILGSYIVSIPPDGKWSSSCRIFCDFFFEWKMKESWGAEAFLETLEEFWWFEMKLEICESERWD